MSGRAGGVRPHAEGIGSASEAQLSEQAVEPRPRNEATGFRGIWPCLAYLIVDFGRPMGWLPVIEAIRPGLLVGVWGFIAVLLKPRKQIPPPLRYMFAFALLMVWHVPWAVNNRWALWGLQDYSIMLLGGVLPLAVLPSTLAQVRKLLHAYVWIHVSLAIYGLMHGGTGPGGWIGDENDLALTLNAAIGIGIYLLIETKKAMQRVTLSAAIAVLLAGVVRTNSRGGFVGLAVLGVYMLLAGPHRKLIAACTLLAVIGLAMFAPASYWSEVRSISEAGEEGETGETRLYFWGIAWKMFLDHPIMGVGTNNFGIRAPEYQDPDRDLWFSHTWGRVAHSLYFTLIPEHGLVGVIIFAGLLGWAFRAYWRIRRAWRGNAGEHGFRSAGLIACGLAAGLFAVLATGAFLSVLYYPVIWLLIGLLGVLERTAPKSMIEESGLQHLPPLPTARSAVPAKGSTG